jgi:hypothetical protein
MVIGVAGVVGTYRASQAGIKAAREDRIVEKRLDLYVELQDYANWSRVTATALAEQTDEDVDGPPPTDGLLARTQVFASNAVALSFGALLDAFAEFGDLLVGDEPISTAAVDNLQALSRRLLAEIRAETAPDSLPRV